MRASLSCEEVSFTKINVLSQWDCMQTTLFPKSLIHRVVQKDQKTRDSNSESLSLFLSARSLRIKLPSVNQAQLFQFPLPIRCVPAALARLNG